MTLCTWADSAWLAQVADARAVSEVLQERAGEAARHIARCSAQAGQAGAHFMTLAPELVRAATQLPGPLEQLLQLLLDGDKPLQEAVTSLSELCKIAQVSCSTTTSTSFSRGSKLKHLRPCWLRVQFGSLMKPPWLLMSVMRRAALGGKGGGSVLT